MKRLCIVLALASCTCFASAPTRFKVYIEGKLQPDLGYAGSEGFWFINPQTGLKITVVLDWQKKVVKVNTRKVANPIAQAIPSYSLRGVKDIMSPDECKKWIHDAKASLIKAKGLFELVDLDSLSAPSHEVFQEAIAVSKKNIKQNIVLLRDIEYFYFLYENLYDISNVKRWYDQLTSTGEDLNEIANLEDVCLVSGVSRELRLSMKKCSTDCKIALYGLTKHYNALTTWHSEHIKATW